MKQIAPFVGPRQEIGSVVSSSGFFWMAHHLLGEGKRLFGFQRVPFISRVTRYGQTADLKGYKSSLKIGGNRHSDLQGLAGFFTDALSTPTHPLGHYLEATLTNSNPLLHPSRIYGMLSPIEGDLYDHEILFYEEWDDFSSKVLIECDEEFQAMLRALPVRQEEIPSLLSYYESTDEVSLTRKIRSIVAFKGIKMCMTPRYLSTIIKQVSGITAKEWIDRAVVTNAKVMLRYSSRQVAEVAYALNFPNVSFFCKFFKHATGQTPQEYREKRN